MATFNHMEFLRFQVHHREDTEYLWPMVLPYMDLTILISGQMVYYYDDQKIVLEGGDAILFPQGSKRERMQTDIPVQYASFNICYDESFTPLLTGRLEKCVTPSTVTMLNIFKEEWNLTTDHFSERCSAIFEYLYYQLIDTVVRNQKPYITMIRDFVQRNLDRYIFIQEIADSIHVTQEYCCAFYKKETGQTLIEYINEQRMLAAQRLIRLGTYSLSDVAKQMGYKDYNYFSRTFKKVTGLTPLQYKKNVSLQNGETGEE